MGHSWKLPIFLYFRSSCENSFTFLRRISSSFLRFSAGWILWAIFCLKIEHSKWILKWSLKNCYEILALFAALDILYSYIASYVVFSFPVQFFTFLNVLFIAGSVLTRWRTLSVRRLMIGHPLTLSSFFSVILHVPRKVCKQKTILEYFKSWDIFFAYCQYARIFFSLVQSRPCKRKLYRLTKYTELLSMKCQESL